jgi:hypothetical protein
MEELRRWRRAPEFAGRRVEDEGALEESSPGDFRRERVTRPASSLCMCILTRTGSLPCGSLPLGGMVETEDWLLRRPARGR